MTDNSLCVDYSDDTQGVNFITTGPMLTSEVVAVAGPLPRLFFEGEVPG